MRISVGARDRRTFLVASGAGAGGAAAGPDRRSGRAAGLGASRRADSTILFFLCGGASHVDTWDLKPDAPAEYRGPFRPIATTAPGVRLCEHLPLLARQAHHLAVVNSVGATVNTNDHHAGYYYNLTGHVPDPSFLTLGNNRTPRPDDWPYMGCVAASRRAAASATCPTRSRCRTGRARPPTRGRASSPRGWGSSTTRCTSTATSAGRSQFQAPGPGPRRRRRRPTAPGPPRPARGRRRGAAGLRRGCARAATGRACRSGPVAAGLVADDRGVRRRRRAAAVRERYGQTINGMSLLLARRLVEAGVPFMTVFWKENEAIANKCKSAGGWDTHGNNFNCLKENLLPEFDRGFSALIEDLAGRGLLDATLLLVTSEMGRTPKIGDPRSGGTSARAATTGRIA